MNYETSTEIEFAIAGWFGIRTHVIVPNLSWGLNLAFECDLAVLSGSGYLYEVEIKISRSDLIRDREKHKWHYYDTGKIRKLWFAIPERLLKAIDHIPDKAGILVVSKSGRVSEIRKPQVNGAANTLTDKEQYKVARLGAMRVWKLKGKLIDKESK